jgi:hypothetical protein
MCYSLVLEISKTRLGYTRRVCKQSWKSQPFDMNGQADNFYLVLKENSTKMKTCCKNKYQILFLTIFSEKAFIKIPSRLLILAFKPND